MAEKAEADGDISTAIGAWKAVLPYVYAKPKAIEIEPEAVIELARDLATARAQVPDMAVSYHALLQKYIDEDTA